MTLAPWNQEAWQSLTQRRERGALAHALLLAGPAGVGKRAFADAFVAALLCASAGPQGFACGTCKSCLLLGAGSHPDLVHIGLELRDDGKPRTEITVDQIRGLGERLVLTSQFGGYQIAVIDPADGLNASASNALLKTLEEPTGSTIIVLLSDFPARLSATIRSRCQRIDLRAPSIAVATQWLAGQGIAAQQAADALQASGGNPGLALSWIGSKKLALRDEVIADLLALQQGRSTALEIANRWAKSDMSMRLWFAAMLAQQLANAQTRGEALPFTLTCAGDLTKLAAWFDHANRARESLRGPLRPELVVMELLIAWGALTPKRRRA